MSGTIYCQEAKDLLDAFYEAIRNLMELHQEQFQAVVRGDLDSGRVDDLIFQANERKHDAKQAYLQHLGAHGCSNLSTIRI
jgi:hypothetical protein